MHYATRVSAMLVLVATFGIFAASLNAQFYGLQQADPRNSGTCSTCTYQMGYSFTVNVDGMQVTHLGVFKPSSGTETGRLYNYSTQQVIATVNHSCTGNQWNWGALTTPVTLTRGQRYIVTSYGSGTGYWLPNASGNFRPSGDITFNSTQFTPGTGWPSSQNTGSNYGVADIQYVKGPQLAVTALTGQSLNEYADAQGLNNDGFVAGAFDIECQSQGPGEVNEIELELGGTAGATAISELKIYRDANTDGQLDSGDVEIGTGSAFAGSPATTTITLTGAEKAFSLNQTKEYLVVIKLAGTAAPGETITFSLLDLDVTAPGRPSGTPAALSHDVTIQVPDMTIADDSAPSVQQAILGTGGNVLQSFTIDYPAGPENSITSFTFEGSGTGNEATGYDALDLYLDDGDSSFNVANETHLGQANFSADDGQITFTVASPNDVIPSGSSLRYFLVADFNTNPNNMDTFATQLISIGGTLGGTNVIGEPAPTSGPAAGISILGNALIVETPGSAAPQMIDNNATGASGDGVLLLDFTLAVTNATWTIGSLELEASGTMNDASAFSELAIYEDVNQNGTFDGASIDVITSTVGTSFPLDNGAWPAFLTSPDITLAMQRHFFVVGKLAGTAVAGETFRLRLGAVVATPPTGGVLLGVPSADGPEFTVNPAAFDVGFNGPQAAQTVNSTEAEAMLLDFNIETKNSSFTISSITFAASGTGNDATAFSQLMLYADTDDSGDFDATNDLLASPSAGAGFTADNGTYTATLIDQVFAGATNRRFFLIGEMAANALSGQTFNAAVSAISATSATNTNPTGVPGMASTALVIDVAAVTISLADDSPDARVAEKTGAAFSHHIATFDLMASNGDLNVHSIRFTGSGTGDWMNDLDSLTGLQVYLDDGDGALDTAIDSMIFAGAAGATTNAAFTSPVSVSNGESAKLHAVLNVRGDAGGSLARTYLLSVSQVSNVGVDTGVMVILGSPPPVSRTLTLIEYFVSSISPARVDPGTMGQQITIIGSGFSAPVTLTIDGNLCPGVAGVSTDGTTITGLSVPAGMGAGLEIVLSTGVVGQRTLTQTFSYATEDGSETAALCSLNGSGSGQSWLFLLIIATGASLLLRRKEA